MSFIALSRITARASAAASERSERSGRLQALVSQRPAFQDTHPYLRLLEGRKATRACSTLSLQPIRSPVAKFTLCCVIQCGAGLLAVVVRYGETRAFGLLTCLHDVASQATCSCVVGVTPSVTPPRWFLVMEASALLCHCPQLPFSRTHFFLARSLVHFARRERVAALWKPLYRFQSPNAIWQTALFPVFSRAHCGLQRRSGAG
jgi:hypothetical protein